MSANPVLAAFPRRPLALRKTLGDRLWPVFFVLFGLAIGGFGAGVGWTYLPGIIAEHALAANGVEATPVRVGGQCRTQRAFITTCTLELTYNAQDKRQYRVDAPIFVFGSLDHSERIVIRHDRTTPMRVGTNWGHDALINRWIALSVSFTFLLGIAGAFFYGAVNSLRTSGKRSRLAQAPQPGVVTVTGGAKLNRYTTNWSYVWFDGQRQLSATEGLSGKSEPFWIDPANGQALALVGADGGSVLLDRELAQVNLADGERQALQDAQRRVLAAA